MALRADDVRKDLLVTAVVVLGALVIKAETARLCIARTPSVHFAILLKSKVLLLRGSEFLL